MLIVSRKKNQGVVFSGPGRVIVVDIRSNKVRLGFEADPSTTIDRDEVIVAIARHGGVRRPKENSNADT